MKQEPILWGIIPARYASSRFPGKPLADIHGKSMIERVYERACQAHRLSEVWVATDDERIMAAVQAFGGQVALTGVQHRSGTERLAEMARRHPAPTHFINIQGDEPYIHPEQIDQLAEVLLRPRAELATLARRIDQPERLLNPNVVKVVLSAQGEALYFSRAAIPHCRDQGAAADWLARQTYYQHVGLYGYNRPALLAYPDLSASDLEQTEQLEQLRWLAHGYRMQVGITELSARAVDTPEDLEALLAEHDSEGSK